ncbi:hypothetical protein [Sphingobacterium suaedae]|uniref:Lipocalin-like domain-containing protein n=1 Tax=Sphingobacterium suaedae TaxID=1686402 RepID=A0ABW5KP43_9SPHI
MKELKFSVLVFLCIFTLVSLSGCDSLIDELLDEEQIDEKLLIGKWKAVEYFSNEVVDPSDVVGGTDFSDVNQIETMIKYQMESTTCPGKLDSYEGQILAFELDLSRDGNMVLYLKEHDKSSVYDGDCKLNHNDDSHELTTRGNWVLNAEDATLSLSSADLDIEDGSIEIEELTARELVLRIGDDEYETYIKLKK